MTVNNNMLSFRSSFFAAGAALLLLLANPSSAWFVPQFNGNLHQVQVGQQKYHSGVTLFLSDNNNNNSDDNEKYDDFTPRDEWTAMSPEERKAVIEKRRLSVGTDSEIFKGTVKWFDLKKGFGFITREGDGEEIFVHQTAIQADGFRAVDDGASVEFQIEVADGRTKAVQVTGPGGEPLQRGYAYKPREAAAS